MDNTENDYKLDHKDRGYAWVILLSTFLIRIIDNSASTTLGIFIIEYLEYFNVNKAIIVTSYMSFYFMGMALSGESILFVQFLKLSAKITHWSVSLQVIGTGGFASNIMKYHKKGIII